MLEEVFFQLIANVGFPIAITSYLLLRFEKILNNNTEILKKIFENQKK